MTSLAVYYSNNAVDSQTSRHSESKIRAQEQLMQVHSEGHVGVAYTKGTTGVNRSY